MPLQGYLSLFIQYFQCTGQETEMSKVETEEDIFQTIYSDFRGRRNKGNEAGGQFGLCVFFWLPLTPKSEIELLMNLSLNY